MRDAPALRRSLLAAWITILGASAVPPPALAGEAAEGKEAAEYFHLDIPLIGGGALTAADLRGEILVVDVWGTWCGPCRKIIPHLIEIQEEFGPLGVRVIGISAEPAEDEEEATRKVLRYAAEMGMNYSLGIFDPDLYQWIRSLMRFEGDSFTVPSTFVVDVDGEVIARYPGYFHGQEQEIRRLLRSRVGTEEPADRGASPGGSASRR
jgi:thiol-disulfide isomerase/thioredoxin